MNISEASNGRLYDKAKETEWDDGNAYEDKYVDDEFEQVFQEDDYSSGDDDLRMRFSL